MKPGRVMTALNSKQARPAAFSLELATGRALNLKLANDGPERFQQTALRDRYDFDVTRSIF
jgi:hypothetical protein